MALRLRSVLRFVKKRPPGDLKFENVNRYYYMSLLSYFEFSKDTCQSWVCIPHNVVNNGVVDQVSFSS